ncbi:hypothetical protein [Teichococcus cervicalis]|uniref:Nif11 domain-containing protein n=1 Tax=Pseudoroseomonas cervicalis ATCC 49957 TaxID=525371 RepID=D5RSA9_9PROT|nr:hypothetical protein [Pseudoroseomonas cervicalis]EFH09812.1 hypothetical protein HMPREF0731_3971 [Pseudoroseomonas cervicalis ATCC 49957]
MHHASPDLPHHPELHRLAAALRAQPALAERYARAADLDTLQARLSEDGYAVPRAALERAIAQSELDEAQLDQVQGGGAMIAMLVTFLAGMVLSGVGIGAGVSARNSAPSSGEGRTSIGFAGRAD